MKRTDIFRLRRQQLDTIVGDKELRMTFISPHRSSLAPVVESRPPAPQLVGVPPARERRGEMFFFFGVFDSRPPELAPIAQRAAQRRLPAKIGKPPR
jgi:hypothetical protein